MWRASQPTGCSGARHYRSSRRHQGRALCSCASEATQTTPVSPGQVRSSSPTRPGCSALEFGKLSPRSSRKASSNNCPRAARVAVIRPGIWSISRVSYGPLGSPYFVAGYGPLHCPNADFGYGPLGGHEVITTLVGRSAATMRALPGAPALCSVVGFIDEPNCDDRHRARRALASDVPPSGGRRGEKGETAATRKVTLGVHSLLRRLPASLAGIDQPRGRELRQPADGPRYGDAWRCPAQPRVQARARVAVSADDRVCAISLLRRLPSCRAGIQSPSVGLSKLGSSTASRESKAVGGRSTRHVSSLGSRSVRASTGGMSRRFDEAEAS